MSPSQIIKAEEDTNGNLYIYDKYAHLVEVNKIINGETYSGYYDVYSASDRKHKLVKNFNFEDSSYYDENIGAGSEEWNKSFMKALDKATGNKILTFKHTFKKNSGGEYYWYSTEPILK